MERDLGLPGKKNFHYNKGSRLFEGVFQMHRVRIVLFCFSLISVFGLNALANQAATITRINGSVQVFTHPTSQLQGPGQVKYENKYYRLKKAKVGDKVQKGNILRTAPGSKARVVFDNGDQINVAPGSSYKVDWAVNSSDPDIAKPTISLKYGKIRAVISKKGPRSKLRVRTRSATMGVRGTDFYVSDRVSEGGTRLTVIRGKVQVKPKKMNAKPIEVKKGYTAEVTKKKTETSVLGSAEKKTEVAFQQKAIEIHKTTKQEIVKIHRESVQKKIKLTKEEFATPSSKAMVEKLEKKAVENTLKDIRTHDPKLYAKLNKKIVNDSQKIDAQVMKEGFKAAPKAPSKPYLSDLDDLDENAYDTYFKIED